MNKKKKYALIGVIAASVVSIGVYALNEKSEGQVKENNIVGIYSEDGERRFPSEKLEGEKDNAY